MSKGKAVPVTFNGVEYESDAALARALGVTPPGIRYRRSRGLPLDGGDRAFATVGSVTIRDKTYPSPQAAADGEGVKINSIYQARLRGTLDSVGLPQGRKPGGCFDSPRNSGRKVQ